MTFRQNYEIETKWDRKVLLIDLYHSMKSHKNVHWRMIDTANYFNISLALVSENLKLVKLLGHDRIAACDSRKHALEIMRLK